MNYVTRESGTTVLGPNFPRAALLEGLRQSHDILLVGTLESIDGLSAELTPFDTCEIHEHVHALAAWRVRQAHVVDSEG